MSDAREVAEAFFDAWTGGDLARARQLVHDDVSFIGPIDTLRQTSSPSAKTRPFEPLFGH